MYVRNPVNRKYVRKVIISPDNTDCIVFWTKNPANLIPHLKYLDQYMYYFQFTLTGYDKDAEPFMPKKRYNNK